MSSFALCWRRGGGPVPPEAARAIRRRWSDRDAGAARERGGDGWHAWSLSNEATPGAEDALPLDLRGWRGTGALRLDDRDALAARLRDAGAEGGVDDANLAWRSFAVWGEGAPSRWLGDYALAAVTPDGQRLLLTRGTLGVLHLFYAVLRDLVIVSDDPDTIALVPGTSRSIDEQAIAEFLGTGQRVSPGLTFRAGIRRLPAGHTLVLHNDGREASTRHWTLPEPADRGGVREGEVIEEFRELLGRAVRDRLRGGRGALLLSGGLDSPLIAVAARRAAPEVSLTAVTQSWRRLLPKDDESDWAALAAERAGLPHQVMEMAPACGFDDEAPFSTPEPSSDPEPRVSRLISAALARIAPVALLGEDPDTLLFPATLLDQVRSAGIARTASAWRAYRELTGTRPWIGARRSFGAVERWRDRRARKAPEWVRAEFVARHPLPDVPAARPHPTRPLAARALSQPTWDNALWEDAPAMSGAAVQVLLPYMDPRVIAFLFSLPSVPWGQRKHLVRSALRGTMPDALVDRPKTPLRGYYEARVREWRRRAVRPVLAAPIGEWVDVARWHATLERGTPDETFAAWRVLELSRWISQPGPQP